jgi:transposase IS200 family protein
MGSTFFSLHYHFVFSTKDRRPLIHAEWRPRMHSYLGGIIRGMNGVAEMDLALLPGCGNNSFAFRWSTLRSDQRLLSSNPPGSRP